MKKIEKDDALSVERESGAPEYPFSLPAHRFDQKNEMFKRTVWDEELQHLGRRFHGDVEYRPTAGYRKLDYAFRNAAWNIEWSFGCGNSRSNSGLYAWDDVSAKTRRFIETGDAVKESPAEMSRIIKKVAAFLGADLVGICRLHPRLVYSHEFNTLSGKHYPIEVPEECNFAVVMALEMDHFALQTSPTGVAGAATGLGYSRMAITANLLASFIRGLGYRAIPTGNDTALSIPLAMAAGLGEWSRMGLLVTERFGPRVRLCKVFTDLPLQCDSYRPFGVVDFCETCRKCAISCPSGAIPQGRMTTEGPNISNHAGVRKWYVNAELCYGFWAESRMDCTNCIRVCPFNKPPGWIHELARAVIRRTSLFNRSLTWLDDIMGYDRPRDARIFWDI